jgi:hypothetical protein
MEARVLRTPSSTNPSSAARSRAIACAIPTPGHQLRQQRV